MKTWLPPASARWLLWWELRHGWRSLQTRRQGLQLPPALSWLLRGLLIVLLHCLPLLIFWLDSQPRSSPPKPHAALLRQQLLALFGQLLFASMAFSAIYSTVSQLASREVLDLQRSSPVPARTLARMRQYLIAGSTLIGLPLALLPFAHIGPFFGHWHTLLLYPAVLGHALTASALGMGTAAALIRLIGVARAKRYAHWLGVGLLLSSGLLIQWLQPHISPGSTPDVLSAWARFWAGSVSGDYRAVLVLLGLGLLLTPLVGRLAGQLFMDGIAEPAHSARRPREQRLRGGLGWVILRKEWRLMSRNPMVAANLASPLVLSVLPLLMGGHGEGSGLSRSSLLLMCAFMAPATAHALCWAASSLDEAPALAFGAPQERGRLWRWQLLAGLLPTWLVMLPPMLIATWGQPAKLAGLALLCLLASLGAAMMARAQYRPVSRADARRNLGYRPWEVIIIMAYSALWAGTAASLNGMALGLAALPLLLGIAAWAAMKQEEHEYLYE